MKNIILSLIGICFSCVIYGQTKAVDFSSLKQPSTCFELEDFAKLVLDSSYFFRGGAKEISDKIIRQDEFSSCEYMPLVLSINGFQNYITNHILASRQLLLKADSIYQTSSVDSKFNIRNKIFLGLNYNHYGDTLKAITYYQHAVNLSEASKNLTLLADAKKNISDLYLKSGDNEKAESLLLEALELAKISNNKEMIAFANLSYSGILNNKKEFDKAIKHIQESQDVFVQLNNYRNLYLTDIAFAEILIGKQEFTQAIEILLKAERRGNDSNHKFQHGIIYKFLGDLHKDISGQLSTAYYEKALTQYSGLTEDEYTILIDELTSNYTRQNDIKKLVVLVKKLQDFQLDKDDEKRIEFEESIDRELQIQEEIDQNKLLQLTNKANSKKMGLITFASIICILLAIYALFQLRKNKELNNKISLQNEKLNNQNIELKNFASVASHDLKAPVRSIASFAGLVEKLLPESSDPKLFQYVDIIKTSSLSMNSLVSSLLKFTTLENIEIDKKEIVASEMFSEVINNLYTLIEHKEAKIHMADNLPQTINGDENLLKIVFQNLINNALKFVDETKNPVIHIAYESNASQHIFKVADNGIGIKEEHLQKIFLIFERLHSSSEYEGSGIGLATCKKIIDMHKGELKIESVFGKGSSFFVLLPKSF